MPENAARNRCPIRCPQRCPRTVPENGALQRCPKRARNGARSYVATNSLSKMLRRMTESHRKQCRTISGTRSFVSGTGMLCFGHMFGHNHLFGHMFGHMFGHTHVLFRAHARFMSGTRTFYFGHSHPLFRAHPLSIGHMYLLFRGWTFRLLE